MDQTKIDIGKEEGVKEYQKFVEEIERTAKTSQEVVSVYEKWGRNYEIDVKSLEYCLPEFIVDYLEKISEHENINKDSFILDLGAGTGLVGKVLRNKGYTGKIDALDGSPEMLKVAMELPGVYNKSFCHIVEPDTAMPDNLASGAYDVALICGILLLPNFMQSDCLKHFVNSVRIGGLIVFTIRKAFNAEVFNFTVDVQREAFRLESLGIWKLVDMEYRKGYRRGLTTFQETESVDSFLYAYKKIKNL